MKCQDGRREGGVLVWLTVADLADLSAEEGLCDGEQQKTEGEEAETKELEGGGLYIYRGWERICL